MVSLNAVLQLTFGITGDVGTLIAVMSKWMIAVTVYY